MELFTPQATPGVLAGQLLLELKPLTADHWARALSREKILSRHLLFNIIYIMHSKADHLLPLRTTETPPVKARLHNLANMPIFSALERLFAYDRGKSNAKTI